MQKNVQWKGLAADTTEDCYISFFSSCIMVHSDLSGVVDGIPVNVEYYIKLTTEWKVIDFEIYATKDNGLIKTYAMKRETGGGWSDGTTAQHGKYSACNYIDISLTPFTNSLPINGLVFKPQQPQDINVIYIDIMEGKMRVDKQSYTKLNGQHYEFRNGGGKFTANITVDEGGIVTYYPNLFEKI